MGEFHQKLLQSFTNFKNKYLKAADGLVFKFTKDPGGSGKYGYLNSNGEFVPFRTAHTLTRTITAGTSSKTTDMGEDHKYRYIKTNPTPSQTKTVTASRSAQTVTPDSGKLLSSVTVNKYPDATGTYGTITTNGTHDMGATNNYRYVGVNIPPSSLLNGSGKFAYAAIGCKWGSWMYQYVGVVGGTQVGGQDNFGGISNGYFKVERIQPSSVARMQITALVAGKCIVMDNESFSLINVSANQVIFDQSVSTHGQAKCGAALWIPS